MIVVEQARQHLAVAAVSTDLFDSHGLNLPKILSDGQRRDIREFYRQDAHPIWTTPPPHGQLDKPTLLQLQEQRASRHVFELTRCIAPIPLRRQLPGHAPTAPLRMLIKKLANLAQPRRINHPALNRHGFRHEPNCERSKLRSPAKNLSTP